jgi:pimeloyl-ACP methyl ester carboxylesterase
MKSKSVSFHSYDGTILHGTATEAGSGKGSAWILLIHGITADRHEWGFYDRVVEALARQGISSLAFDFRCHGRSDALPTEQMTLTGIYQDITAAFELLRQKWDLRPHDLSIVARSFGGGIAVVWANSHREWVRHLFLCSPVLNYENDVRKTAGDWEKKIAKGHVVRYVPTLNIGAGLISELPIIDRQILLEGWGGKATIFHGTADTDVPFIESKTRRADADLIALEGAEHNMGAPGDDDLEDPMTKRHHQTIINTILKRLAS